MTADPGPHLLVAIETATDVCSVACLVGSTIVAEISRSEPRMHSRILIDQIRDVLAASDRRPEDIGWLAVSAGPGSYTGLRIGTSTAKGLAMGVGADLVGVPTHEALVLGVDPGSDPAPAALVAQRSRKSEFYISVWSLENQDSGTERYSRAIMEPAAVAAGELAVIIRDLGVGHLVVAGDAAVGALSLLESSLPQIHVRLDDSVAPSAGRVGLTALRLIQGGQIDDLDTFEPSYLKDFVAKPRRSIFERLPFHGSKS